MRVQAGILVLQLLRVEQIAGPVQPTIDGDVGTAQLKDRNRQVHHQLALTLESGLQVELWQCPVFGYGNQGAVTQTGPQRANDQAMVRKGVAVQIDGAQPQL